MKFILGKKLEMTQKFLEDGTVVPVTVVKAGPCVVTQAKNKEKDGYKAVVVGFSLSKKTKKPQDGYLKKLGNFKFLREFRLSDDEKQELKKGDRFDISSFQIGDIVQVTGSSKGKGFAGVVKRHHFHGSPASHGHKDQLRMPGSIGATGPARVFKGVRMGGHMGAERVTIKNLEIVDIDKEKGFLFIKGAVPGSRNNLLLISGKGELSLVEETKKKDKTEKGKEDKKDDLKVEKKPEEKKYVGEEVDKFDIKTDDKKEVKKESASVKTTADKDKKEK